MENLSSTQSMSYLTFMHNADGAGNFCRARRLSRQMSDIHLRRRQGLANRLRPELGEYAPQRADARRERVTVFLNDFVEFLGKSGGFFV